MNGCCLQDEAEDAFSPSSTSTPAANFLMTNPEALKSALESQGETLRTGLENLQQDMKKDTSR